MLEGLDQLLKDSGHPGLAELRRLLADLLGGPDATGRLIEQSSLKTPVRVYRVRFAQNGSVRSWVVKRLEPGLGKRNELVATRWLPAVGLGGCGAKLVGVAGARNGECVWHVYEDLGDGALDATKFDRQRVKLAVELIAQVHTRFARHPLLAECRRHGGDLGIHFYLSNVRDAIYSLEALRPPAVEVTPELAAVRDRLLQRMHQLLDEYDSRARALAEFGGPATCGRLTRLSSRQPAGRRRGSLTGTTRRSGRRATISRRFSCASMRASDRRFWICIARRWRSRAGVCRRRSV